LISTIGDAAIQLLTRSTLWMRNASGIGNVG